MDPNSQLPPVQQRHLPLVQPLLHANNPFQREQIDPNHTQDQQQVSQKPHTTAFRSRYHCLRKIGSGSFGVVYLAHDNMWNARVAVKFESKKAPYPQLVREGRLLGELWQGQSSSPNHASTHPYDPVHVQYVGIPKPFSLGQTTSSYYLSLSLLGPSLESLFQSQNRFFSLKTILLLAEQMILRLQYVHEHDFLHRDIKPDNFVMGEATSNPNRFGAPQYVHLIDFGLAKRYRSKNSKTHLPLKRKSSSSLTGTARYASITNHKGYEQSRRDDLESLGYVLCYFLRRGDLPWSNQPGDTKKEKYANILSKKTGTSLGELLYGFPKQFAEYLRYVRALSFDETPNYEYLRSLFRSLYFERGYPMDMIFDWEVQQPSIPTPQQMDFVPLPDNNMGGVQLMQTPNFSPSPTTTPQFYPMC